MSTQKTPFQYLLDLTGAARIKAAEATGDKAAIAKAKRLYNNLLESECEFTTPWQNPLANNIWQTDLTCRPRGFKLPGLRYNTGSLTAMIRGNANIMANKSSLDVSTVTGLYYVYETESDHLLIQPQSNVFEALKMTGYTFQPEEFEVTMYPERDINQKADGYVDIKHSVVAGRIFLSNIQRGNVKAQGNFETTDTLPGATDSSVVTPMEVKGIVEETGTTPAEGVKLETEMKTFGETLAPVEGGQDTEESQIQALLDADKNNDPTALAEAAADKTVAAQEAAKVVDAPAQEETSAQQTGKKKK